MKYRDGQDVRIGDRVQLGEDRGGIVVASMDTGEYTADHPASQWSYLKVGVMIEFLRYGLIHFEEPDEDLMLIARGDGMSSRPEQDQLA